MSTNLSLASIVEANRLASEVPFLCLIDLEVVNPDTGAVVIVVHVVRNSEDITFNGNLYTAGSFDIQVKYEAGKMASVNLSVTDYTQHIQSLMEQYGGGIGSNVTLYVVNAANLAQGPEIQEFFQITSAVSSEYQQQFTLGAENVLMQTFPRRRQTKNFCSWRFKSPECGYTGSVATCDLTLQGVDGCESKSNSINFGAFPGLNGNGFRYV